MTIAGDLLGKNGRALAFGFYTGAAIWCNKHLTDGFLPLGMVKSFLLVENGLVVADALTKANLFEKVEGGFKVHDFHDWNPKAQDVKRRRKEDRDRKRES